jgi:carbon-monoxide dehydrogenase large subunit
MTAPFTGRREDARLLTGAGRFAADWNLPGQLHACFVRAERAHADIVSVDTAAAARTPGVVAVFAGDDVAHFGAATPLVRYPGRGGMTLQHPHRPVLARGRVRHVGEEIALVVAETAAAAQDGAERVAVAYRERPVVVDAADALAAGAPLVHDAVAGNLAFDYEYGNEAATAAAFAAAAHVARVTLESQRLVGNPMEPKSCLASYDAARGVYELYAPSQGVTLMVPGLSAITGVAREQIRFHARDVGGGFGVRGDAYPEYCALLHATRTLGRPVKWTGTRTETFLSDHHGRAARLAGALALDAEGRFLALRIEWLVNAGAYLSHPGPLINTLPPSLHAANLYRIPVLYGRHRLVLTNTTPTTAYRGAGRPNVAYLAERLVDAAARETGIDRVALRRRNLIARADFPYQTPIAIATYDSGDPPGLLDAALALAGWTTFEDRRAAARAHGRLRGIGCAAFVEPAGAGGSPKEEAALKFGASGNI